MSINESMLDGFYKLVLNGTAILFNLRQFSLLNSYLYNTKLKTLANLPENNKLNK